MEKQIHSGTGTRRAGDRELDTLFKAAGSVKTGPLPGGRWRADVMREVRRIGPLSGSLGQGGSFGKLAWRLSPVAFALVVVLSVLVFQVGSTIDYQLVEMAVTDPVDAYVLYVPF